ncbi:MAG: four helix bundle protein [Clostridia bacterium]|nr:four helix bundle protein [Clostridia bacterium]
MKKNLIEDKSFAFAVRAVRLYKHLTNEKHEYIISKQFLRSGTSIGANVCEAERGQSRADFVAKMAIALNEANETDYWLRLLYASDYLTQAEFESISGDANELIRLLVSICKTAELTK